MEMMQAAASLKKYRRWAFVTDAHPVDTLIIPFPPRGTVKTCPLAPRDAYDLSDLPKWLSNPACIDLGKSKRLGQSIPQVY